MATLPAFNFKGSSLIMARILAVLLLLLPTLALAQQVPAKEKKEGEKMGQATLKEAKVTARVLTSVEEVGPMKVRLNVLNPTGKQVRLSILNFANQPVYQDAFQAREYNKVL